MATQKLNLTRDQLATFLKNHELIKQFEKLIQVVDEVSPSSDTTGISIQAGNADAAANEALAQIVQLAQDSAINGGAADSAANEALAQMARLAQDVLTNNCSQKAVEALDGLSRVANALELLALAPTRNNIELSHDVSGVLPYTNQPARVRSTQVLTWLSM